MAENKTQHTESAPEKPPRWRDLFIETAVGEIIGWVMFWPLLMGGVWTVIGVSVWMLLGLGIWLEWG
jgi:hypothetical protein